MYQSVSRKVSGMLNLSILDQLGSNGMFLGLSSWSSSNGMVTHKVSKACYTSAAHSLVEVSVCRSVMYSPIEMPSWSAIRHTSIKDRPTAFAHSFHSSSYPRVLSAEGSCTQYGQLAHRRSIFPHTTVASMSHYHTYHSHGGQRHT